MKTPTPPTKPILKPDDIIRPVAIETLLLDPKNARAHHDRDIKAIMASIQRWGWVNPVVVRQGTTRVVCGHGRIQAARRMGLKVVPVLERYFATDDDAKAYAIADNRTAELSSWDLPNLRDNLAELTGVGFDLALTGWTPQELDHLFEWDSKSERDPDALPVMGGEIRVKPGDLWCLGQHRILCGDTTDPANWDRLMDGRVAACCFTDPPYGVAYESQSGKHEKIANDDLQHGALVEFLYRSFKNLVAHTDPEAAFYVWHASSTRADFTQALTAAGLTEQQYLIWVKPAAVLGHDDYQWGHEPCFYAARAGYRPKWYGDRSQPTVWRFSPVSPEGIVAQVGRGLTLLAGPEQLHLTSETPKTKKQRSVRVPEGKTVLIQIGNGPTGTTWEVSRDHQAEHPTQKPVELASRALRNSTQYDDIVIDAFLGSGGLVIAGEQLGRAIYGTERDPKYVDLIVRRWEDFTGKKGHRA